MECGFAELPHPRRPPSSPLGLTSLLCGFSGETEILFGCVLGGGALDGRLLRPFFALAVAALRLEEGGGRVHTAIDLYAKWEDGSSAHIYVSPPPVGPSWGTGPPTPGSAPSAGAASSRGAHPPPPRPSEATKEGHRDALAYPPPAYFLPLASPLPITLYSRCKRSVPQAIREGGNPHTDPLTPLTQIRGKLQDGGRELYSKNQS